MFLSFHAQTNPSTKISSKVFDGTSLKPSILHIGKSECDNKESELSLFANTSCNKNGLIRILLPVPVLEFKLDLVRTCYEHNKKTCSAQT